MNLFSKYKSKKIFFICIELIFFMLLVLIGSAFHYKNEVMIDGYNNEFSKGWTLQVGEESKCRKIDLPYYDKKISKNQKVTISKQILEKDYCEPSLIFGSSQQNVTIYLNGEVIYELKTLDKLVFNKTNGSGWILLDLPKNLEGKFLEVEYFSSFDRVSGYVPSIYYGDKNSNILFMLRKSSGKIFVGLLLLLIAVFNVIFAFRIRDLDKKRTAGMLALAFTFFSLSIWMLIQTERITFMSDNIIFNYLIEFISFYIMPVFYFYYIYSISDSSKAYIFKYISKFHFILFFIILLLQFTGIADFFSMYWVFLCIFNAALIYSFGITLKSIKNNNHGAILILLMFTLSFSELVYLVFVDLTFSRNIIAVSAIIFEIKVIYNFSNAYIKMQGAKNESIYLKRQFKKQLTHYKNLEESYKEIIKYKHDIKNHFMVLNHLIVNNENEAAAQYLEDLRQAPLFKKVIINTGNPVLDAVLNEKRDIAERNDIEFETNIVIAPSLKVEAIDWCIIFSNILDNAIEACIKMKDGSRKIEVNLVSKNNMLVAKIINSTCESITIKNNEILTSKANKMEHGYGLINIKKAIEKYDGQLDIKCQDSIFVFSFMLYEV